MSEQQINGSLQADGEKTNTTCHVARPLPQRSRSGPAVQSGAGSCLWCAVLLQHRTMDKVIAMRKVHRIGLVQTG